MPSKHFLKLDGFHSIIRIHHLSKIKPTLALQKTMLKRNQQAREPRRCAISKLWRSDGKQQLRANALCNDNIFWTPQEDSEYNIALCTHNLCSTLGRQHWNCKKNWNYWKLQKLLWMARCQTSAQFLCFQTYQTFVDGIFLFSHQCFWYLLSKNHHLLTLNPKKSTHNPKIFISAHSLIPK